MNLSADTHAFAIESADVLDKIYGGVIETNIVDRRFDTQVCCAQTVGVDGAIGCDIFFPGTQSLRDARTDAQIIKTDWRGGRVHRGFLAAWQGVALEVEARLAPGAPVRLAGHSLGGALAQLAALQLCERVSVAAVHTFGAPRVGNAAWRDLYNANLHDVTYRWEAEGDPVPWMPPWLFGYRHAGRAAYLKNDGRVIVAPKLWAHVPAFAATLGGQETRLINGLVRVFDPHQLSNYQSLLSQLTEDKS